MAYEQEPVCRACRSSLLPTVCQEMLSLELYNYFCTAECKRHHLQYKLLRKKCNSVLNTLQIEIFISNSQINDHAAILVGNFIERV